MSNKALQLIGEIRAGVIIGLCLCILLFIFRPLILLFIPGILLVHQFRKSETPLSTILAPMIGFSLAFWIISFWLLRYLPLSLSDWAYAVTMLTILLVLPLKDIKSIKVDKEDAFVIVLLLFVLILRFVPFFFQLSPAGADMSMHSYMARLILEQNGVPKSYEPILPIKSFGAYAAGFQTLMALISKLGGISILRAGMVASFATHFLITLGLYSFLLNFFGRRISVITASMLPFALVHPQSFVRWGGNPTILSLFFIILSLAIIERFKHKVSPMGIVLAATMFAACPLTHIIPTLGFAYIMLPFIFLLLTALNHKEKVAFLLNLLICSAMSAILLTPYILSLSAKSLMITPQILAQAKSWQAFDLISTYRSLFLALPIMGLSALGLLITIKQDKITSQRYLLVLAAVALLILNSYFWILPVSPALYPSRVALLLILPFSLFSAKAIDTLKRIKWSRMVYFCLIIICIVYYSYAYLYSSIKFSAVTNFDLAAFSWIEKNTPKNAVFLNNYGDAGLWIPAVTFRRITNPHSEPINIPALKEGLKDLKPHYAYIGKKKVYSDTPISRDKLLNQPDRYKEVYGKDQVYIFKII
jgi:hypothetical protein